jgi:hypothetical protein
MINERENTVLVSKFISKAHRLKNNFKRWLREDSCYIDTGTKPDENKPISTRQLDRNYYIICVTKKYRILLSCNLNLLQCRKPESGLYDLSMPEAPEMRQERIINFHSYRYISCIEVTKWNLNDRSPPILPGAET